MSRKRRRRKVGKHISLSATDADWETVRSNANAARPVARACGAGGAGRFGRGSLRYLMLELVERDASEEDAGVAEAARAEARGGGSSPH